MCIKGDIYVYIYIKNKKGKRSQFAIDLYSICISMTDTVKKSDGPT